MPSKKHFCSLRARADFLDLKATGQIFHVNFWLLVNVRRNDLGRFRCGFTLPRQTGPAVIRNRMRRWGKEYLRRWVEARVKAQSQLPTAGDKTKSAKPISKSNSVGFDLNLIFRRREKDFYRTVTHKDFDVAMDRLVAKLGRLGA